jgi:hypothetical protein
MYYEPIQTAHSVIFHIATKIQNSHMYYEPIQTANYVKIHTANIQLAELIIRCAKCL